MYRHTDGQFGSRTNVGHEIARRSAGALTCLALCLSPALLRADDAPTPTTAPAFEPLQGTVQRIEASAGNRIELLSGRGIIINLTKPTHRAAIGNPQVADATVISPQQVMLSGKRAGTTNLILWDGNDSQVVYDIVVQPDVAMLRAAIEQTAPHVPVRVVPLGEKILLIGTVPDVDTAERLTQLAAAFAGATDSGSAQTNQNSSANAPPGGAPGSGGNAAPPSNVINHLIVAGEHQVVLRCTVAEVSKKAIRQLGINGWLAGDNIRDMFAINQIDGINPVDISGGSGQNVIQPGGLIFQTGNMAVAQAPTMSLGFPRVQMQLFFKAMRENDLLRVLAEPNLTAISGQEASFLAGGEFPYQVPQGLGTTTIEWKEFGVRLRFTPTVIGRQLIRLRVMPEVSERDFTAGVTLTGSTIVPGLKSRRAETTVELASGCTIAIAGLLSEQVQAASKKIPALGDVPVLGALFSSVEYQKSQTELVILVTPELVSPLMPDQVQAVPGQFARDPNDFELFGLGMVEGKPASSDQDPASALETQTSPRYPKLASSPPDQMTLHGPWGPAEIGDTLQ